MTPQAPEALIKKNDLIKDYINFALVIFLSFFFKFSILELVESVFFFSIVFSVSILLFQLIKCFEYENFSANRFLSIIGTLIAYTAFDIILLQASLSELGYEEIAHNLNVREFIIFIPFIPFALYSRREYFKDFVWQVKENKISLMVFLILIKMCILLAIIVNYKQNPTLMFYIIYTTFFFPFLKTIEYIIQYVKQKKEVK